MVVARRVWYIYIEQVAGQQVQVVPVLVAPTRPAAALYNCSQVDSSDISWNLDVTPWRHRHALRPATCSPPSASHVHSRRLARIVTGTKLPGCTFEEGKCGWSIDGDLNNTETFVFVRAQAGRPNQLNEFKIGKIEYLITNS